MVMARQIDAGDRGGGVPGPTRSLIRPRGNNCYCQLIFNFPLLTWRGATARLPDRPRSRRNQYTPTGRQSLHPLPNILCWSSCLHARSRKLCITCRFSGSVPTPPLYVKAFAPHTGFSAIHADQSYLLLLLRARAISRLVSRSAMESRLSWSFLPLHTPSSILNRPSLR